jgi:FtsH-binding integral membrane protein
MRRAERLSQRARPIEQNRVMRRTLDFLAGAYLPLLASTLVLAGASLFRREYRSRLSWLVVLTVFVFLYNAAACLEVAILNSLEVPRYSTVQMFFTLLAEFLAGWLLLETLLQPWARQPASAV